jgi:hypothetical protein
MGRAQRQKGVRGEREVIVMLQPVVDEVCAEVGVPAPRLQRTGTMQADGGGSDIAGLPWLAMEVKNCATLRVGDWWVQTLRQCGQHQTPALAYKVGRQWFVMCYTTMHAHGQQMTVPAIVEWFDWLPWFRARLVQELLRGVSVQ